MKGTRAERSNDTAVMHDHFTREKPPPSPLPLWERWTRCVASRTGEGSVSADRDPSSGADFVRATFSHKGRREEKSPHRPSIAAVIHFVMTSDARNSSATR